MIHLHRVVHDLILLEIKYGAGGCRSAVKYLPSMHEALGLILTTANKQTNKQKTKKLTLRGWCGGACYNLSTLEVEVEGL
jgi:hypothetical protein